MRPVDSALACEQAPGEDGKNFGERETDEFGERSDRGGTGALGHHQGDDLMSKTFGVFYFLTFFSLVNRNYF